ncbi:hypothetical protein GGI07_001293 [Coemansia sp. Benny D115]|nr:hypothetical protein GGI07_001293 [Coemansia sp. Benny D115]
MIAASTTIRTKPEWESQVDDSKVHEIWSAEIKEKHGVKDVEIEYILAELKYYAKLNAAGQKHGTSATVVDMVWTTEIPADDELARDVRNQVAAVLEDDLLLKTPDWSSPDNVSDSATIPEFNDKLRVAGKPRYTKRTLIDPSLYPFVDGATSTSKSPIALPFDERKHIYMGWGPGITKYMRRKFMDYVQDHYDDLDLSFECDDVKRALVKAKLEYEARYNPKRRAGKESLAASDAPLISDNAMDPGLNASNINLQDIADRYLDDIYHWLPSDTLVAADGTQTHPITHGWLP